VLKDELTSENMIKYAGYSILVSLFLLIFYEFEFGVMILVTGISLGIFGAIFSYAMFSEGNDKSIVLLMLPTVSLILAWTYVVNDEKISHIGKYVRHELAPKLRELVGKDDPIIFGWESYHRSDYKRLTRKTMQVAIDIIVFGIAPVASMCAYYTKTLILVDLCRHLHVGT